MDIRLMFQYKGPKTAKLRMETEWFNEKAADLLIQDMLKTGRMKEIIVLDELGREWTVKEFQKLREKAEEEPRNPIIYFDGGFNRLNGEAGIGVVIYYDKGPDQYRIRYNAKLSELLSSNEAEYAALYNAVDILQQMDFQQTLCNIKGDAQGVLKQLAGEWPCYEESLNWWLDKIEEKIKSLGLKMSYEVIPRNENKEAHKLASQALKNQMIDSHLKIDPHHNRNN
ncbi:reverse transcriptase-like protein [Siminovitchia sediminis]|uniref:Reverse transcriptase-like protein n=1 Tax=Siminovitchia sediminis TaxID=1274353 RepID=A0ABW4KGX2_9BACI